jgi:hypothetical protein
MFNASSLYFVKSFIKEIDSFGIAVTETESVGVKKESERSFIPEKNLLLLI